MALLGAEDVSAALPVLAGALGRPEGLAECARFALAMGDAAGDATQMIGILPAEQTTGLLDGMFQVLATADPMSAIGICGAVLDVVYPARGYDPDVPLTDDHRRVIRAVADTPAAWRFNVNLFEVPRADNLPPARMS